ncbi:lachesin isoform X7 [Wyeomyia smithii]|uniref:lachesin isoform X7 n=1 Tax=Wyeomyia smithii TaxID=174621 RepID=UPI002467D1A5|nr:lachesin isoform X7 [Wyeomyia smithii]
MTIKLHECKHKHHHKHHRSDGSRRINFPRDCSVGGGSTDGSAVLRLKPEEVVQTRADGNGRGELATSVPAAAVLEVGDGVVRSAAFDPVDCTWPAIESSIDSIDAGRSLVAQLLAQQKQPVRLGQQSGIDNNNYNSNSCSHPTSFSVRFFRSQVLQTVVVLYIALVVIIANAAVAAFEPDFVYPLENVTVAKGRDATFTCVVNNLGGYRVSGEATPARVAWIKADAKAILAIHEHVITNNGRLSVTHNDYNTWTLVIRNVKMEDRGLYMCQVNTDPMKMQTAFLEVVIPPDIIYEETSGDMMVPEGGSAKLVCKARGYPKPKIIWRREDTREIIARNGTHGKMKATVVEGEMLSLTKVTRSEMGAYMCIASNGVPPSVSKRMKLQVHFHPLIQVPNQLVGAPLGTDVTVICNVEASPKAINYWQRENGEMIISNERYSMNENESSMYAVQMTLVIRKLHKADMGGYKCISKNSIGDAEGTIRLYASCGQWIFPLPN